MKYTDYSLIQRRAALLGILALGLPAAGLYAAGTGTAEDPFTGEDVPAVMDGGAVDTPAFYLIDADTDFGSSTAVYVGMDNPENNLNVTGATLGGYFLRLGDTADSNGNTASVSDSTLALVSSLRVGNSGSGNAMTVTGASTITTGSSGYASAVGNGSLTDSALGCDNALTISGTGIMWTNASAFAVGNYGSGNSFELSAGAGMSATDFVIGMGDTSDPELGCGNEVLISGADTVANFREFGCVGNYGSGNSLTISEGARVEFGDPIDWNNIYFLERNYQPSRFYVGFGYGEDGQLGHGNSLLITGAGSVLELNMGYLYIGDNATDNTVEISDMAALNAIDVGIYTAGNILHMSGGATLELLDGLNISGTENAFICEGAGTTVNVGYELYMSGEYSVAVFADGTNAHFMDDIYVNGNNNQVVAFGEGTIVTTDYGIYLRGEGNTITATSGALVKVNDDIDIDAESDDFLCLSGGFVAVQGDRADMIAAMIEDGQIKVWDEPSYSWKAATANDVSVKYFNQTDEIPGESPKDATSSATFAGYDGLIGYTLVSAGDDPGADLLWAGTAEEFVSAVGGDWYTSPWYVPFYSTLDLDAWIFSNIHGWQYISEASNVADGTFLWDDATASWWYTNAAVYPYMYQFVMSLVEDDEGVMTEVWGGAWYYYRSGESPDRVFWDFATDADIAESTFLPAEEPPAEEPPAEVALVQ
ncbi:MAG: hypothetical protein WC360_03105 [Opitutales bacterium]|jgi:hypothetical protein